MILMYMEGKFIDLSDLVKNPILKYKIYINQIFSESGAGLFLSI